MINSILKNQLNHQPNIVILQNFAHDEMFSHIAKSSLFSSQMYVKEFFYIALSFLYELKILTHLMAVLPSYRNQSIGLLYKSIDWFLYDSNTGI